MKGYWLTLCHVTDSELYNKYIKLAGPAIEKYGGKFLARGGQQTKLEGESFERTVLLNSHQLMLLKRLIIPKSTKKLLNSLLNLLSDM